MNKVDGSSSLLWKAPGLSVDSVDLSTLALSRSHPVSGIECDKYGAPVAPI